MVSKPTALAGGSYLAPGSEAGRRASLRLLWVSTKAPWPPRDGGRLLQLETLRLLAESAGEVEVELVAPVPRGELAATAHALEGLCLPRLVAAQPRPLPLAALLSAARRVPVTAVRHELPAVGRAVARAAAGGAFDVVHAEQAQSMPQALAAGMPVVLRAQNVESELWRAGLGARGWAWLARREGSVLARWEGAMMRRATRTVALSEHDATALRALAPEAGVEVQPVPFPAELPPGPPLPGEPAITLLVGAGWRPNREGAEAFLASTWPRVFAAVPAARLHIFGEATGPGKGVTWHEAPDDPAAAFAEGAILVVPLAVASGVRVKILEAWARGLPVVATHAAAAGLGANAGEQLFVAAQGEPLAGALIELCRDSALRERMARAGRDLLRRRHHPQEARRRLLACYADAAASPRS